eukprot:4148752-Amphidinium_carterae.1
MLLEHWPCGGKKSALTGEGWSKCSPSLQRLSDSNDVLLDMVSAPQILSCPWSTSSSSTLSITSHRWSSSTSSTLSIASHW